MAAETRDAERRRDAHAAPATEPPVPSGPGCADRTGDPNPSNADFPSPGEQIRHSPRHNYHARQRAGRGRVGVGILTATTSAMEPGENCQERCYSI